MSSSVGGTAGLPPAMSCASLRARPFLAGDGARDLGQVGLDVGLAGDPHEDRHLGAGRRHLHANVAEEPLGQRLVRAGSLEEEVTQHHGIPAGAPGLGRRGDEAVVAQRAVGHDQGATRGNTAQGEQPHQDPDHHGDGPPGRPPGPGCRTGADGTGSRRRERSRPRLRHRSRPHHRSRPRQGCRHRRGPTELRRWRRLHGFGTAHHQRVVRLVRSHVEAERRVLVGHEGDVGGHAQDPAVESEEQVVDRARVAAGDREHDGGDERQQADQSGAVDVAPLVVLHDPGAPADEDPDDQVVRDGQQPPLDEHEPAREVLGVVDLEVGRVVLDLRQREGRVAVGRERAVGVVGHAPRPAQDPDVEVEDRPGVAAGEQDREERDDAEDREGHPQEGQHDEVRNREEPLDQPEPA